MQHVLARFWARRSGRGWNLFFFSFLCLSCFTPATATPSVVSLRFQTGLQSTDTTIDANESVGEVRIDSEVRLIFDEDITLQSTGQITLFDGTNYSNYSMGSGLVVPSNESSHLVLNEGNAVSDFLSEFVAYSLTMDPNTVQSVADGSPNVDFQYTFSTGDFTPPALSATVPANSEPSAQDLQTFQLIFSEAVAASPDASKVITLQNLYTGESSTIVCQSNSVVIDNTQVTVSSGGFFDYCQRYEVTYDADCFLDTSPSANGVAVLSSGTYSFDTSCMVTFNPPHNDQSLALDGTLKISFSEVVQRGSGNIVLTPLGFEAEYRAISIADTTQVSLDSDSINTTMTISLNDPLLASTVARSYWCRINAVSLNDCKGQIWDITMGSGVLQRVTPTTLLAQVDLLEPLQVAGSVGQTYRVRTVAADVTPPVMTVVTAHGTSETAIRVVLRLDESGTSYCEAFPDGTAGQKLAVTLAEIGTTFSADATFNSTWGFSEMEVDVSGLSAKTFYSIFCYAEDVEYPTSNVMTVGAAVATRQRVRTLDTTAPTTSNCSAQATAGREDAIDVTLTLDEMGTVFCSIVRSGLPHPSRFFVAAEGVQGITSFYQPHDATVLVDMESSVQGLHALQRGTDYNVFCWAKDAEGVGQDAPIQCGPDGSPGVVRTLDLTPPQMMVVDAEAIAKDTLRILLQVDEGSKVWCAAWTSEPSGFSSDFENIIKAESANCTDSFGNECGTFWVYDLDDLEDTTADGVATPADFDASHWKYQQDVSILLLNLEEATEYTHIYCFAEDDEDDGLGTTPNKMTYNASAEVQSVIGVVKTLDQTPPSFTLLEIQDPTTLDNAISVSFALNEPGTAYCRATRVDSGESAADMQVLRIQSANWLAVYDGNATETITMTKLENVDPLSTNRDDWDVPFEEATLYDVYCWAKDSAVDTRGYPRPNFMTQDYVGTDVSSSSAPMGGRTGNVWVTDVTPPQMILVETESLDRKIEVTLQLNEPGTVWCQIMSLEGPNSSLCDDSNLQENDTAATCFYETYIKGTAPAVFSADVPVAYRNVYLVLDRLVDSSGSSTELLSETSYQVLCFAQDDWDIQAVALQAAQQSPQFAAPTSPNKVSLAAVHTLRNAIGTKTTLDPTPPTFSSLEIQDPTAANDQIVVSFTLNEPGTAYCRATRSDSGQTAEDMHIITIMAAAWSNTQNGSSVPSTITIPKITNRADSDESVVEAQQYDVYCLAQDDATSDGGLSRPNVMTTSYIRSDVVDPSSPQGGRTAGVWVVDATPPTMIFVRAEAIGQETLHITLQLDEPGTIWCQAAELAESTNTLNCRQDEIQEGTPANDCYFEDYVKGANDTLFQAEVNEALKDVSININRIPSKSASTSTPLQHEPSYAVFCFAEDDWPTEVAAAVNSPNMVLPTVPNKVDLAAGSAVQQAIGNISTLDEAPPTFTLLQIQDPTDANDRIIVTFALNEPGTAYCRPTRSDSGETAADMHINRILTASWSSTFTEGNSTIEITQLQNKSLDIFNNDIVREATQYDVYCWAEDDAINGVGFPKHNLMAQDYVGTDVSSATSPVGGATLGVWVQDLTPPSMVFVRAEAIAHATLQVTLQLSEPGTVWCQAASSNATADFCSSAEVEAETLQDNDCYFETFIKGNASDGTEFLAQVSQAYRSVQVSMNALVKKGGGSHPLQTETAYDVLCFAEDDWVSQADNAAVHSVNYVSPSLPMKTSLNDAISIKDTIGLLVTLDEDPPTFTRLQIEDPTTYNDRINITLALNEPGTAYCRATRSDSGETAADMTINRILTASWSAEYIDSDVSIEMYKLENVDPALTARDDVDVFFEEQTQYDIYCWAQDSAKDTKGLARPNYMSHQYVATEVNSTSNPQGGATLRVWVVDSTPPQMTFVRADALASATLQVTLQLNEPGTIWCQAVTPSASTYCATGDIQDVDPTAPCHVETFVKGGVNGLVFKADVHTAFLDVNIDINRIAEKTGGEANLTTETAYNVICFAEDDWPTQADGASLQSVNYVSPSLPMKTSLNDAISIKDTIGLLVTLDEDPPTFTRLQIEDPTTYNDRINITLALNEPGTAYCRATRSDSGETAADMTINRILTASWSAEYIDSDVSIEMYKLENVDPALTARDDVDVFFEEQTQYDIYCWAQDSAKDTKGLARPNYMSHQYVATEVNSTSNPQGGATLRVWVVDSTPPQMTFVRADALASATLQVTLQLNEPGTIWCQAVEVSGSADVLNCNEDDLQQDSSVSDCFYETFVKASASSPPAVFTAQIHEALGHASIDINQIVSKAGTSTALQSQHPYGIFCFAEDDWDIQADAFGTSPNYASPTGPNKVNLTEGQLLRNQIGTLYTLDEAPPTFTSLDIVDPTALNDRIVITFTLNEAGTVYCRPTRSDSGETSDDMPAYRIISADWSAIYDGSNVQSIEISGIRNVAAHFAEPLVEAHQYDIYCWAQDNAVDFGGFSQPNFMPHSYVSTAIGSGSSPSGGKIEGVWMTDSTPPSMLFVRASGVKTEDTLQIILQLSEPGTVWCQVAETVNASLPSLYCREDEISSDPSAPCYWETFVKGSQSQGTSFSKDVPEAFTFVEVEMNRIWTKTMTSGDPLLPETFYKIFCYAEDDWPTQAASASTSVFFNSTGLQPQGSTFAQVVLFKDAVGSQTTLDLTAPNITVSSPTSLEDQITVVTTLSEPGTAWCQAVRSGFAVPAVIDILASGFSSVQLEEPYNGTVTITSERNEVGPVPLQLGTDYEVYCYAQDDLCEGCGRPNGIDAFAVAATQTSIRTLDLTPPRLRVVDVRSIARDKIQITIQADEGVRLWCAAWPAMSPPDLNETNFETMIKNWDTPGTSCKDSWNRDCGNFWVFDLDDLEDTVLDGMSSEADYWHFQTWRKNEDVTIVLSGLMEQTEYSYIYCFAEDDESDGRGSSPNKMLFDSGAAPSQVVVIQGGLGNVTTLDESPPEFTHLSIQDPTASNDRIEILFALNEPGTAYCRATRSDSGEGEDDMNIPWIQTARWSNVHDGSTSLSSIVISKIENIDSLGTNRINAPIQEAQQYDIYCWALDSAVNTDGWARQNIMQQSYVVTDVNSSTSPVGGKTKGVWVVDSTPPSMIFISAEAVSSLELQVTLQLDEPGTVWCQPSDLSGSATQCQTTDIQNQSASSDCYWLDFIQGNDFRVDVHEAFVDYSINMNLLYPVGANSASPLSPETEYEVHCYAQDDWNVQANSAESSVNFVPQSNPNGVAFLDSDELRRSIGVQRTLDASPPIFTALAVPDPTTENDRIVVTFALNEAGTAYCRPTRSDSGETGSDMTINRIISAGWSATHDGSNISSTISMSHLENVLQGESEPIYEASQYDIYCAARDNATDSRGLAIPNWMPMAYVTTAVGSPSAPAGGLTSNVWVVDSTPPGLRLVEVFATSQSSLQIRLQLDEPGTVWCAPLELDNSTFCSVDDMSNNSALGCDYELFIKSQQSLQAVFSAEIVEPYRNVDIEVDRIVSRDELQSYPLEHEHEYRIFCFAEDDWPIQASSAALKSPNFVAPVEPMKITLAAAVAFSNLAGVISTLDQAPPSFTYLDVADPTSANNKIVVTFSLNEAGVAYCRATRSDSGETSADMTITRIRTANWMAQNDGVNLSTIEITKLENVDPLLTSRDDEVDPIMEASQYDVYCWAQDAAVDSYGYPRRNYMDIQYVRTDALSSNSPQGGRSPGVWVVDTTPPTMTLVRAEGIAGDTLQLTLQLDEPGTIWCAAVQTTSDPTYCLHGETPSGSFSTSSGPGLCEYETFVKGEALNSSFSVEVQEAHTSVQLNVNKILRSDLSASDSLVPETTYRVYCFAEDNWPMDAISASSRSQSYVSHPSVPNKVSLDDVLNFSDSFPFLPSTLDVSPPSFTLLQIQDPTVLNSEIEVVFSLNEAGTAYCRPVRTDSAEAANAMHINHILAAGWSATHDPQQSPNSTIIIAGTQLSPLKGLDEAKQYDVYCWAQDEARGNFGFPRSQYMSQAYVSSAVSNASAPEGAMTSQVWVVDSTPPAMNFVSWKAITDERTLQITLQLDEPGTVWCQAALNSSITGFCADSELQDSDPLADCYFETYIKGYSSAVFRKEVHEAERDIQVEVNQLPSRDGLLPPTDLLPKTGYSIFCFAEDDWLEEATAGSINFVAPQFRNKVTLGAVVALKNEIEMATTLDLTAPNLTIHSTAATEDVITVFFSLNEAGTLWCRAAWKATRPVFQAWEIVATGFFAETQGEPEIAEVNITAENVEGDPLVRGTDYEVYCFAQDALCLGCTRPSGFDAQAILDSLTVVRTADATPPRITFLFGEAISSDTIQLTLQLDEGGKIWCAAWDAEPAGISTNFESLIKASANCTESDGQRECGTFWIYDLDDVEDTALDAMDSLQDYVNNYRANRKVQISLSGLKEETIHSIYCFAEDDETDGVGSAPNKMYYNSADAPAGTSSKSLVEEISNEIGSIKTLDGSPPIFTELSMTDPTAAEGVIVVSFALNEPGTAYCRATRTDSGETPADMQMLRVIAADWSAVHTGDSNTSTITMTQIQRVVPLESSPVPIEGSTQYNVYCWAKDDAMTTSGFERPNYMTQEYLTSPVVDPLVPLGGATMGLWVTDVTPPTLIYVTAAAISRDTIRLTLQLNEPGTIWCAAAELDTSSDVDNCKESEVQDTEPDDAVAPCYYESFIKGSQFDDTVFSVEVANGFWDVDVEVNRIWQRNRNGSSPLRPETAYKLFCFAEDAWVVKTASAGGSPNFIAPTTRNKSPLSQVQLLTAAIGARTTLDEDPPSFTKLAIQNPTATNDRIEVVFALNEPGTAYCRARRIDVHPGTSMKIGEVVGAGWWASFSDTEQNITMTQIYRPDLHSEPAPFDEQHQYDVFCWAHDNAVDGNGFSRPNSQLEEYVNTETGQSEITNMTLPGGKTSGIWVADTTPPSLLFVRAKALSSATLQVRLQLDEPGTVWCAATDLDSVGTSMNCKASELQDASSSPCYYEDYIKGNLTSIFQADVAEAFVNVDVEMTTILQKDMSAESPLQQETTYQVFCYAEDDWKSQADSVNTSADYVSPTGSIGTTLQSVQSFAQTIGTLTTLDEAPPTFTVLQIQDPTASEGILEISFALNEVGTAYCRATRSDSGETASEMPLFRVVTAHWFAVYDGTENATITMNALENRVNEGVPLAPGAQYDVYCWAKDSAVSTSGHSQPNYMAAAYVGSPVQSPTGPTVGGGYTQRVWVADTTPPQMLLTSLEPLSEDTILVVLRLNEPGTVWCAATLPDDASSIYCRPSDLQDSNSSSPCYYEDFIKGSGAQGTTFMVVVPSGFVDVSVEVNKIALATGTAFALSAETEFVMLCFAQDNFDTRSQAAYDNGQGSPNFVTPQPNKVTLAQVNVFAKSAVTLDLTAPTVTSRSLHAPPTSESTLEVVFSVDEASTLYCLAVWSGDSVPHVFTITTQGQSQNCSADAFTSGDCSGLTLTLPNLLRGQSYDVHCHLEDDNISPLQRNRNILPVLTAQVNDLTPPQVTVLKASAAEAGQITVTLWVDEPGTIWCFSPAEVGQAIANSSWVWTYGASTARVISESDVNKEFEVVVAVYGTEELPLISEKTYETYCGGQDTATNPNCTDAGCNDVPNVNTLTEMAAVRDSIGQIITRDIDPPTFAILGARGVSENMLTVTLQLNEPGTAYCRSTRTDSGWSDLHLAYIMQAGFSAVNDATGTSSINIDKLSDRSSEPTLLLGTAYDVYCWAKDNAQIHFCLPNASSASCYFEDAPNYMAQSYVGTRFAQLVHPPDLVSDADGGFMDMVRTWDTTPPVLVFVQAESRSEDSITVTLQLDEPGTAYCAAYEVDGVNQSTNVTFADVFAAQGGPFSFDIPSDSALRSFSASAFRNFEITVTGLSREVLYYVYCAAEDDELIDGCWQRNSTDCSNNEAMPILTESTGRYTLDLTPPNLTVLDAVSYTQDSVTVTVAMNEAGTVWCEAVVDLNPPPSTWEIVAAGFKTSMAAGTANVVIQGLIRDVEYDVYCFAQDDGTMSATNNPLEVEWSKKNGIGYTDVVATKMDAHVLYDSIPPVLLSVDPVHNAVVAPFVNISFTFDEDIQVAGNGTVQLLATSDNVSIDSSDLVVINRVVSIPGSLHGGLSTGTWRVYLPVGVIEDLAGNSFEGIPDGSYQLQV